MSVDWHDQQRAFLLDFSIKITLIETFSIKVINHSGIQIVIKNLPTIFGHMAYILEVKTGTFAGFFIYLLYLSINP